MKERPILFSGPMVRAILDGKKTQTRRIVRPLRGAPFPMSDLPWRAIVHADGFAALIAEHAGGETAVPLPRSPYGVPGDRLWVRETWQHAGWTEDGAPWIRYAADDSKRLCERIPDDWNDRLTETWAKLSEPENVAIDGLAADRSWRPSIFLPRWASRIDLDVTAVRVERLQAITEDDARAEGVIGNYDESYNLGRFTDRPFTHAFFVLWDAINGDRAPVESNPWVWVVEFQRADGGAK